MKAWRVHEKGHYSKALTLEDIPPPEPGPGEARIRVGAGTVNFADILLCRGTYQDRPSVPFTPGLETAGVVESVGAGVGLVVGDHVAPWRPCRQADSRSRRSCGRTPRWSFPDGSRSRM